MSGNFAVIKNGDNVVVNIIVADEDFKIDGYFIVPYDNYDNPARIGDLWINGKFVRPDAVQEDDSNDSPE